MFTLSKSDEALIRQEAGVVVWSLNTDQPDLLVCLPDSVREFLRQLLATSHVPVARRTSTFQSDSFFRPIGHVRAFYGAVPATKSESGGIIGFKGSEVWSDDLASVAEAMAEGRSSLNGNDFFVLTEAKAPIAYMLHEAIADAKKAAGLFAAVHETFHYHPNLPLPLCVLRWPNEAITKYEHAVMPYLSETTKRAVSRLLTDGLAVYIYFYPGRPERLRHTRLGIVEPAGGLPEPVLVDQWVTLFTQILIAGYLPATLSNQKWGCCIQDQNVCMDGGFVDVDSVEQLDQDPNMFLPNLLASLQMLAHSVFTYTRRMFPDDLAGRDLLLMGNSFGSRLHHMVFLPYVWNVVVDKLRHFDERGLQIPRELSELLLTHDRNTSLWAMSRALEVLSATRTIDPSLRDHVVRCSQI